MIVSVLGTPPSESGHPVEGQEVPAAEGVDAKVAGLIENRPAVVSARPREVHAQ